MCCNGDRINIRGHCVYFCQRPIANLILRNWLFILRMPGHVTWAGMCGHIGFILFHQEDMHCEISDNRRNEKGRGLKIIKKGVI